MCITHIYSFVCIQFPIPRNLFYGSMSHISGKTLNELISRYGKYLYVYIYTFMHSYAQFPIPRNLSSNTKKFIFQRQEIYFPTPRNLFYMCTRHISGKTLNELIPFQEIYASDKTRHFEALQKQTGVHMHINVCIYMYIYVYIFMYVYIYI